MVRERRPRALVQSALQSPWPVAGDWGNFERWPRQFALRSHSREGRDGLELAVVALEKQMPVAAGRQQQAMVETDRP
jgi:hypothetical protein